MSRWMMPFWCACWIAWQTWMNSSEPLRGGEIVLVAIIRDPDAAHQFHHEIGPAGLGRAGIEHLGDVRMVHHRQRLPLRLEPGDHLPGVHAQLDDLERDPPAHRLGLLGHVDHAAAAFAELLASLVPADDVAGLSRWVAGSPSCPPDLRAPAPARGRPRHVRAT